MALALPALIIWKLIQESGYTFKVHFPKSIFQSPWNIKLNAILEVPLQFRTMSLKQAAGHSSILGNNDLDID